MAKKWQKKRNEIELKFKNPDEDTAHEESQAEREPIVIKAPTMSAQAETSNNNLEIKVMNPHSFQDVVTVATLLIEGFTVALNLESLESDNSERALDFLRGVCFAIGGDMNLLSKNTYIITPSNIGVSDK